MKKKKTKRNKSAEAKAIAHLRRYYKTGLEKRIDLMFEEFDLGFESSDHGERLSAGIKFFRDLMGLSETEISRLGWVTDDGELKRVI